MSKITKDLMKTWDLLLHTIDQSLPKSFTNIDECCDDFRLTLTNDLSCTIQEANYTRNEFILELQHTIDDRVNEDTGRTNTSSDNRGGCISNSSDEVCN